MPEATGSLSIQYPATFNIEFYKGEDRNVFMPIISTCFLTSLGTTYNATSNIFHADGAPVETDISLAFQETKTLTRQDLYNTEKGNDLPGLDNQAKLSAESLKASITPETDPTAATGTTGGPG